MQMSCGFLFAKDSDFPGATASSQRPLTVRNVSLEIESANIN